MFKVQNSILVLFIFLQIHYIQAFKEWWESSNVLELTSQNFNEYVGKEEYVVVKFYTKWCRYCRILSPEYEKFNEIMKTKRKDVIVARLEGEVNEEIAYEYGISSFPKVVLFWPHSADISSTFKGSRTADQLLKWVEEYAPDLTKFRDKDGKLDLKLIEELEEENESQEKEQIPNLEIPRHLDSNLSNSSNLENLKNDILFLKNKYEELNKIFTQIKNDTAAPTAILNPPYKNSFDSFDIVVTLLLIVIIISAVFTVKKIYSKLL